MPYASKAQQRWAHATAGTSRGMSDAKVAEFDKATNFSNLPERKGKKKNKRSFGERADQYASTH